MKIVLAIDGSNYSKVAISQLGAMPLPIETEVCIVNIYEHPTIIGLEPIPMGVIPSAYYEEIISNTKKSAEEIVSSASKLLRTLNTKISITTTIISGLPKREILEKAESFDADLIVVGSQGHGAFSRFLLGSVSQYLATHAKCSVMIVKDKDAK
jgi:nucleotide-binding universal stress UspA family protein